MTPLEGIQKQFTGKAEVRYSLGATYTSQTASLLPEGVRSAPGGTIRPPVTGEYTFVVPSGRGGPVAKLFLNDKELTNLHVNLEAGKSYALRIEGPQPRPGVPPFQVSWIPPADALLADAVDAAKNSDVAVAFVGLNPNLEGEEMRVSIPGFAGGDRTDLKLPDSQEKLVQALVATGKPVVVVLTSGSALAANYAAEHAAAVLQLWYGGEEAGTAIAETLSGANNPAGRLPVTFYKDVTQLPPFEDYSMKGRTYRYFTGEALFGFGYGLSYAKFQYSNARANRTPKGAQIQARVKNESTREGDEVVQLYVDGGGASGDAIRQLRGFQRIHLKAGETREITFTLDAADVPKGRVKFSVGSGQPLAPIPHVSGTL